MHKSYHMEYSKAKEERKKNAATRAEENASISKLPVATVKMLHAHTFHRDDQITKEFNLALTSSVRSLASLSLYLSLLKSRPFPWTNAFSRLAPFSPHFAAYGVDVSFNCSTNRVLSERKPLAKCCVCVCVQMYLYTIFLCARWFDTRNAFWLQLIYCLFGGLPLVLVIRKKYLIGWNLISNRQPAYRRQIQWI